jgi:hypothetical protein
MKKSDIQQLDNSELFSSFYWTTIQLVKEENSVRGATKKSTKEYEWIITECIKRFDLDEKTLIKNDLMFENKDE